MELLASSCGISTVNDVRLAAVFRQKRKLARGHGVLICCCIFLKFAGLATTVAKSFDPELVSFIPVMYAASFACASFWKASVFNAKLNGLSYSQHDRLFLLFCRHRFVPQNTRDTQKAAKKKLAQISQDSAIMRIPFHLSYGNSSRAWWEKAKEAGARYELCWDKTHIFMPQSLL